MGSSLPVSSNPPFLFQRPFTDCLTGTFFFLGLLFGNLPYDIHTLYTYDATEEAFNNSLRHYQTWANIPAAGIWVLHSLIGLGFIGCFIRLYRPSEETKYFDYGSLLLYVVAVCIYLSNLRTGADSAVHGEWGEVDQNTGINVIAASTAMIIFVLGGIVMLQIGLYYGEWEFQQRLTQFNQEEAERLAQEEEEASKPKPKTKAADKTPTKPAVVAETATKASGRKTTSGAKKRTT
jgi:hypothetical protein